ncbi:MAG: hypothetical protein ACI4WT_14340 [Oligosphaeraceae bacterium]
MNASSPSDSDLFYTCSLIEFIGRKTRQRRGRVVRLLGRRNLRHILDYADVLHCEVIDAPADHFIAECRIPQGDYDHVAACQYHIPSHWDIGKVFARLILDIHRGGDLIDTLVAVYTSFMADAISNYNSDLYYQSRGYLKVFYECGGLVPDDEL